MAREGRIGLLLLAPVLAAIAFSWGRIVAELDDVPRDADYPAARTALQDAGFDRARDALVILPPWSLRPLAVLGDLDPISGDGIAAQPLQRYARLWVLVEPDAGRGYDDLRARLGPPALRQEVGRLALERYELPPPSVMVDLRARVEEATIRIVGPEGERPCQVPLRGGVSCGREAGQRVTRQWLLVSENGDDVVWSQPPPRGQRLELEWSEIPIGAAVVIRAGFTREGADRARAPVQLRVLIDGQVVGTVTREPAFDFRTDVIDTARFARRAGAITFAIDTSDNADAQFAWDAMVVGAHP